MATSADTRLKGPLLCPRPQADAQIRLICFPHAGGGPMALREWPEALAPDIEVWPVTLPGRASRRNEPFARKWATLVDDFASAIETDVEAPLALFGHSLGAVLAFEVARTLTARGVPPEHLVASARAAPDAPQPDAVPETDDELLGKIDKAYGGVPDVIEEVPELLERFLPMLRADLELAAVYEYEPGPPLPCPITAIGGSADPTLGSQALEGWSDHTAAGFEVHRFPGGHFYGGEVEAAVLDTIRRVLDV